jgi:hypothetical protein
VGYHTDNGTTDQQNLYHACLCVEFRTS